MQQDPIRFKNLTREAEEKLIAKGLRSPNARDLIQRTQVIDDGVAEIVMLDLT